MGRADGRLIRSLPPFTKIIPHLMKPRYDATNFMTLDFPYDKVMAYIGQKKKEGMSVTLMSCILAAYVRTISKFPEVNRFVISKKIYARKGIFVSFVTLKDNWDGERERDETVVKLEFTGHEVLEEVSESILTAIEENRKPNTVNIMDKVLGGIFYVPFLPGFITGTLMLMDRIGIMPRSVINASPFHTSVFFTNMASIRAYPVYHHLYEFGTTGCFISLGADISDRGKYQMKLSTDERVCSGSTYVRAMRYFMTLLRHPDLLETPPEAVAKDLR
jgi:hypothetical protein